MLRLIDANALKDKSYETGRWMPVRVVNVEDIDAAPTVDAELVRHGRWIEFTNWIGSFGQIYSKCSECGTTYSGRKGSRGDGKGGKFCEECGAKMDGENECSDG